jgi:hypothetical protein
MFFQNIFTDQICDPFPKPIYSLAILPTSTYTTYGFLWCLVLEAAPVSKLQKAAVVSVEAVAKTSSGNQTS